MGMVKKNLWTSWAWSPSGTGGRTGEARRGYRGESGCTHHASTGEGHPRARCFRAALPFRFHFLLSFPQHLFWLRSSLYFSRNDMVVLSHLKTQTRCPRSSRWDRNGDGRASYPHEMSALDHMLLTRGLADELVRAKVDHLWAAGVSDHRPVSITLSCGGTSR